MLRRLKDQLNGGKSQTLPNNSHGKSSGTAGNIRSWLGGGSGSGSFRDGSAASIHPTGTLQQTWQRASVATRVTWISILLSFLFVGFGWRYIRYYNAGFYLSCHSVHCELTVTPVGWDRRVQLTDISRHQLVGAVGIKTLKNGSFITDQNVNLVDTFSRGPPKKHGMAIQSSSYKGPDENGHYISYAVILADEQDNLGDHPSEGEEERIPDVDLKPLHRYMDDFQTTHEGEVKPVTQYRLIAQKFGIWQSKRRARMTIQKFESYIQRRRQRLVVRESAPPAWQGVVAMVFGFVGLLLTVALGQFQDPVVHRGPGVRRQQQQHQSAKRDVVKDAFQTATPARYEVSTSSVPASTASAGFRRNVTQARKRGS